MAELPAVTVTTHRITLKCDLVSKKNSLKARRGVASGGNLFYTAEVKKCMLDMQLLAQAQWGRKPALRHPRIEVFLFISNPLKDRDGIWTTVADALKKAGILLDDSVKHFNGTITHHPAVIVDHLRDERAELLIMAAEEEQVCPTPKPRTRASRAKSKTSARPAG